MGKHDEESGERRVDETTDDLAHESTAVKTYECDDCGYRMKAEHQPGECPNCGGEMLDISVTRE